MVRWEASCSSDGIWGVVIVVLPDDVEALETVGAAIGKRSSRFDRDVLGEK
jgi:hypothetical protein